MKRWLLAVATACVALVPAKASATVVGWVGTPGVTLTTSNPSPPRGTPASLFASTTASVTGTTLVIQIFSATTRALVATCTSGTSCSALVPDPNLTPSDSENFVATVGPYQSTYAPDGTAAEYDSDYVGIGWNVYFDIGSDDCTAPTLTIADGYVGPAYERLQIQIISSTQAMICYRFQADGAYYVGGKLLVTSLTPSLGVLSVDGNAQACSTTAGNDVPGPHPAVAGTVLNSPLLIDSWSSGTAAWFCFQYGSEQDRVSIAAPPTGSLLLVNFYPDDPLVIPPSASPPSSYPSAECQNMGGALAQRLIDIAVVGAYADAYVWPDGSSLNVCARIQGPVNAGGLLSVSVPAAPGLPNPGVTPVLGLSGDVSPCTFVIVQLTSPTPAFFATSPPGANPATLCVGLGATEQAITVGATVAPTLPSLPGLTPPSFTPDPDTP